MSNVSDGAPRMADGTLAGSIVPRWIRSCATSSRSCGDAARRGRARSASTNPAAPDGVPRTVARSRSVDGPTWSPSTDDTRTSPACGWPESRSRLTVPSLTAAVPSGGMQIVSALFVENFELRQAPGTIDPHRPHGRDVLDGGPLTRAPLTIDRHTSSRSSSCARRPRPGNGVFEVIFRKGLDPRSDEQIGAQRQPVHRRPRQVHLPVSSSGELEFDRLRPDLRPIAASIAAPGIWCRSRCCHPV